MAKIPAYHGTLWELPLDKELGFAYVQIIDSTKFGGGAWLVKIMNHLSKVSRKKIALEEFNSWDMLTSTITGSGRTPRKGQCIWRKMGAYPLTETDQIMPDLKQGGVDLDGEENWFLIKNMIPQDCEPGYTYEQVKHLGCYNPITFLHSIHHRVTLTWMKFLGMDYENYSNKSPDTEHIWTIKRQIKYDVNFAEVPTEIRGKVNLNAK